MTLMQALTPRSIVTKKTISLRGLSRMFSQKTPFGRGEIDGQQLRLGIVKMAQDDDDESVTPGHDGHRENQDTNPGTEDPVEGPNHQMPGVNIPEEDTKRAYFGLNFIKKNLFLLT